MSANANMRIHASRSAGADGGIHGTLHAGPTDLPLNPKFPAKRSAQMLAAAACAIVIANEQHLDHLAKIASVSSNSPTGIVSALAGMTLDHHTNADVASHVKLIYYSDPT